jgi:polysaccharide export outer membrane protein
MLRHQGVEVPESADLSGQDPRALASAIYKLIPAKGKTRFNASIQRALPKDTHKQQQRPQRRSYNLGPRDILSITIFTQDQGSQNDDSTLSIPVNEQGFISLPLVGKIQASGFTTARLEREIAKRYKRFVKDPQISVSVADFKARRVFVVGQVNTNGPVPIIHEGTTLFEVISRVGGLSEGSGVEGADAHHIIVQRGSEKMVVDFQGQATNLEAAEDFFVQDGDQIFVPKPLNRFRVLGGVSAAGEFELRPGMTLLDAIAMAGSFTEKSRRDQIRILHRGGGRENTKHLDATRIFHGKVPDVPLEPGDVIYVSEW